MQLSLVLLKSIFMNRREFLRKLGFSAGAVALTDCSKLAQLSHLRGFFLVCVSISVDSLIPHVLMAMRYSIKCLSDHGAV